MFVPPNVEYLQTNLPRIDEAFLQDQQNLKGQFLSTQPNQPSLKSTGNKIALAVRADQMIKDQGISEFMSKLVQLSFRIESIALLELSDMSLT